MTAATFNVADERVVVVGAGRSGQAAARLLASRGARVVVSDVDPHSAGAEELRRAGIDVEVGPHRAELFKSARLVVLSPGVPVDQGPIREAQRAGVPVIGEIELASRWLSGRLVAVTGTKGKSTTTSLAARMLAEGGFAVTAGGNLGPALSDQVGRTGADVVHVVEVSSFQLETIETFRPWIAVLLNFSPDHLDRHASLADYAAAKARVFENQTVDDWAVVNAGDEQAVQLASGTHARRFDFGLGVPLREGVTVEGDEIVARRSGQSTPLVPVASVRLPGRHLLQDVLAAAAVSTIAGVADDAVRRAVEGFAGLEHTLEVVAEVAGVRFVNDSKATNVAAARRAIESFDERVVAIMGGRYKGGDFRSLRETALAHAIGIVAIGEAAPLIDEALGDVVPVHRAASMAEAVRRAFAMAESGGVVVLAPGCSSFDMFQDYAARGRAFAAEVRRVENESGSGVA